MSYEVTMNFRQAVDYAKALGLRAKGGGKMASAGGRFVSQFFFATQIKRGLIRDRAPVIADQRHTPRMVFADVQVVVEQALTDQRRTDELVALKAARDAAQAPTKRASKIPTLPFESAVVHPQLLATVERIDARMADLFRMVEELHHALTVKQ